MTRRLPWILLMISLTFNFFFAGGFLHARSEAEQAEEPRGRAEVLAERLGLSEQQKREFLQMRRQTRAEAQRIRARMDSARESLWASMAEGPVEADRIRELTQLEAEQMLALRRVQAQGARRFLQTLSPQQRRQLHHVMRLHRRMGEGAPPGQRGQPQHRPGAPHHREMLRRRFHADGDGRLSPRERQAATRELQRRRDADRPAGPNQ